MRLMRSPRSHFESGALSMLAPGIMDMLACSLRIKAATDQPTGHPISHRASVAEIPSPTLTAGYQQRPCLCWAAGSVAVCFCRPVLPNV